MALPTPSWSGAVAAVFAMSGPGDFTRSAVDLPTTAPSSLLGGCVALGEK